jgi:hypothetical protein
LVNQKVEFRLQKLCEQHDDNVAMVLKGLVHNIPCIPAKNDLNSYHVWGATHQLWFQFSGAEYGQIDSPVSLAAIIE